MLSDEAMMARMKKGWRGGLGDGTVCGAGSTVFNSRNAIDWLPKICEKYGIRSVCDAGAGDLHWISHVKWDVDYKAYDLFPRHESVVHLDVTKDLMDRSDAVLCRFVLNHLVDDKGNWARALHALNNFQQTAKYLIATNFTYGESASRGFLKLDLRDYLGEPLESVEDGHESGCCLSIWEL